MSYDIILLDADMTLFDFDRSEHEALTRVLAARGCPTDKETTDAYVRINWALWDDYAKGRVTQEEIGPRRFQQLFDLVGVDADPAESNRDYQLALAECGHLLPGAEDFCRRLFEAGKTLAIATNGMPVSQWGRFRRSGLQPYIKRMFVSGEMGCRKPEREYFEKIFAELPVPDKRRCVIMGDSFPSDIQGGVNAGLDTIWYNPNCWPGHETIRPTYEVHSYQEALELLL